MLFGERATGNKKSSVATIIIATSEIRVHEVKLTATPTHVGLGVIFLSRGVAFVTTRVFIIPSTYYYFVDVSFIRKSGPVGNPDIFFSEPKLV